MLRVKYVSAVILSFCLLGMMACSRSTTSPQPEDVDLLISNVTVIDSATGPQVANVLIDEAEIIDVIPVEADGKTTTQPVIDQAERHIDGAGKYLIPDSGTSTFTLPTMNDFPTAWAISFCITALPACVIQAVC